MPKNFRSTNQAVSSDHFCAVPLCLEREITGYRFQRNDDRKKREISKPPH